MLHWTKTEKRNFKNIELDKTAAIKKKKHTVSFKVLDVTYLLHLRLDFFVKERKMNETKWHLERLNALINADMKVIVTEKDTQTYIQ